MAKKLLPGLILVLVCMLGPLPFGAVASNAPQEATPRIVGTIAMYVQDDFSLQLNSDGTFYIQGPKPPPPKKGQVVLVPLHPLPLKGRFHFTRDSLVLTLANGWEYFAKLKDDTVDFGVGSDTPFWGCWSKK